MDLSTLSTEPSSMQESESLFGETDVVRQHIFPQKVIVIFKNVWRKHLTFFAPPGCGANDLCLAGREYTFRMLWALGWVFEYHH